MRPSHHLAVLVLAVAALAPATDARAGNAEWETELGFLAEYHDNYFLQDDSGSTPDETFLTVYGKGEVEFEAGPGDLTFLAGALGSFGLELNRTDHQVAYGGFEYTWGGTRTTLRYQRTQDKVYGEEDDASLYNIDTAEIAVRQDLSKTIRAELGFEFDNWTFEPSDRDRDAFVYEPQILLRWELCERLALRGGFQWTIKEARGDENNYDGPGVSVAAEIKPVDPLEIFLRYRARFRDYADAPSTESNYKRDDTIHDVVADSRYHLLDWLGLRLVGTYRHGDSTRSDRNYDAFAVMGGFFVTFGSGED